MTAEYEEIRSHRHAIQQVIPLLEAIRSVAEIAFRRAEERLPPLARYAARIDNQLAEVGALTDLSFDGSVSLSQRSVLVVISSERGLCGAFNRRLVEQVGTELKRMRSAGDEVVLVCLGQRGQRLLEATGEHVLQWFPMPSFALPGYLDIEREAIEILDLMEAQSCGRLVVMYNAPQRRFRYQVTTRQLFPVEHESPSGATARPASAVKPDSDIEDLFTQLVTEQVLIDLFQAVIESAVSEELARVAAMRLAIENARHLLEELTQQANRARQISETNALLETISGFQAASPLETS